MHRLNNLCIQQSSVPFMFWYPFALITYHQTPGSSCFLAWIIVVQVQVLSQMSGDISLALLRF